MPKKRASQRSRKARVRAWSSDPTFGEALAGEVADAEGHAPSQTPISAVPPANTKLGNLLRISSTPPTLTIEEVESPPNLKILIHAVGGTPAYAEISDIAAIREWVELQYRHIARAGRGLTPVASDGTQVAEDVANAFGNDLYDRYAPQAVRDVFWRLRDRGIVSIQVISNDLVIPWELMRPARDNSGKERQEFLGLDYAIARFPSSTSSYSSPPSDLVLKDLAIIAPKYQGDSALAGTSKEMTALRKLYGGAQTVGDYTSVRALAVHLPIGIIHFAGHGAVRQHNGVAEFVILLEDQEMDSSTWRSLLSGNPGEHPLYFFNACDVGQSAMVINEVQGWAPALLDSGAAGYIGALWPVSDEVAGELAASFYGDISNEMLAHSTADVAQALARTRAKLYHETHNPTALAYVFYGNPDLKLVIPKGSVGLRSPSSNQRTAAVP